MAEKVTGRKLKPFAQIMEESLPPMSLKSVYEQKEYVMSL